MSGRWFRVMSVVVVLAAGAAAGARAAEVAVPEVRATRVLERPIIGPEMLPGEEGASINGPSLIEMPAWAKGRLGRYHLYFAHHNGDTIRLAYAEEVAGPWTIHPGGVWAVSEAAALRGHIASPEVVIDEAEQRIVLFAHGVPAEGDGPQVTTFATSEDGVNFADRATVVGPAYLRVFRHRDAWYGLTHSGVLRRAVRLGDAFAEVARVIGPEIVAAVDPARLGEVGATPAAERPTSGENRYAMRHVGVDVWGDWLTVYFSCVGHRPERILATFIDMRVRPETWRAVGVTEVLQPELAWEGAALPVRFSRGGSVIKYGDGRVRELRDPGVWRSGREAWLIYSGAGEEALGLARLEVTLPGGGAKTEVAR